MNNRVGEPIEYNYNKMETIHQQRLLIEGLEKEALDKPSYYRSVLVQLAKRDLKEMTEMRLAHVKTE